MAREGGRGELRKTQDVDPQVQSFRWTGVSLRSDFRVSIVVK